MAAVCALSPVKRGPRSPGLPHTKAIGCDLTTNGVVFDSEAFGGDEIMRNEIGTFINETPEGSLTP